MLNISKYKLPTNKINYEGSNTYCIIIFLRINICPRNKNRFCKHKKHRSCYSYKTSVQKRKRPFRL